MSLAITTNGIATIAHSIAKKDAAAWYLSTMKNAIADMYHSTIQKHAAVSAHSTTTQHSAAMCLNILAKNAADMYQSTTTSILALQHASQHVLQLAHQPQLAATN
jgi:hypothetical protein